jgi:hypothetical protein
MLWGWRVGWEPLILARREEAQVRLELCPFLNTYHQARAGSWPETASHLPEKMTQLTTNRRTPHQPRYTPGKKQTRVHMDGHMDVHRDFIHNAQRREIPNTTQPMNGLTSCGGWGRPGVCKALGSLPSSATINE